MFIDVGGGAESIMWQVVIRDVSAVTTAGLRACRAIGLGHTRLSPSF